MAHLLTYKLFPLPSSTSHNLLKLSKISFSNISASAKTRRDFALRAKKSSDDSSGQTVEITKGIDNGNIVRAPSAGFVFPLQCIPTWAKWVFGTLFCAALPFYKKILRIEDAAEKAAEKAFETVEKVAEITEKITSEIAEVLPANNKLKEEAIKISHIAEVAEKDAHQAQAIIHKIDEITDEVEAAMEPLIQEGHIMEIVIKEMDEGEDQEQIISKPTEDPPISKI